MAVPSGRSSGAWSTRIECRPHVRGDRPAARRRGAAGFVLREPTVATIGFGPSAWSDECGVDTGKRARVKVRERT